MANPCLPNWEYIPDVPFPRLSQYEYGISDEVCCSGRHLFELEQFVFTK